MKNVLALLLLTTILSAQPRQYFGTIAGKYAITLSVDREQLPSRDHAFGSYYYDKYKKSIELEGGTPWRLDHALCLR